MRYAQMTWGARGSAQRLTQSIFSEGHALIIGAGADLPNTVDDAQGLAGILKDPARCAYRPEQVELLTGKAASPQSRKKVRIRVP